MDPPRLWCRMTLLGPDDEPVASDRLEGAGHPDIAAVDAVARRGLAAMRAGGRLVLQDVEPELLDLLRLAGLVVGVRGMVVEVGRRPVELPSAVGREGPAGPDGAQMGPGGNQIGPADAGPRGPGPPAV